MGNFISLDHPDFNLISNNGNFKYSIVLVEQFVISHKLHNMLQPYFIFEPPPIPTNRAYQMSLSKLFATFAHFYVNTQIAWLRTSFSTFVACEWFFS